MVALRKGKFQQMLLDKTDAQLESLDQLVGPLCQRQRLSRIAHMNAKITDGTLTLAGLDH